MGALTPNQAIDIVIWYCKLGKEIPKGEAKELTSAISAIAKPTAALSKKQNSAVFIKGCGKTTNAGEILLNCLGCGFFNRKKQYLSFTTRLKLYDVLIMFLTPQTHHFIGGNTSKLRAGLIDSRYWFLNDVPDEEIKQQWKILQDATWLRKNEGYARIRSQAESLVSQFKRRIIEEGVRVRGGKKAYAMMKLRQQISDAMQGKNDLSTTEVDRLARNLEMLEGKNYVRSARSIQRPWSLKDKGMFSAFQATRKRRIRK